MLLFNNKNTLSMQEIFDTRPKTTKYKYICAHDEFDRATTNGIRKSQRKMNKNKRKTMTKNHTTTTTTIGSQGGVKRIMKKQISYPWRRSKRNNKSSATTMTTTTRSHVTSSPHRHQVKTKIPTSVFDFPTSSFAMLIPSSQDVKHCHWSLLVPPPAPHDRNIDRSVDDITTATFNDGLSSSDVYCHTACTDQFCQASS